ncbi:hypothetical protein ACOSQ2_019545 [Xanthoceras sorbifolium]
MWVVYEIKNNNLVTDAVPSTSTLFRFFSSNLSSKLSASNLQRIPDSLQDWNNRRQFTPPSDFHADGVNEFFNSQAVTDGSRANEILKQAPFLVPFTSRVKIFHGYIRSTRWIVLLDCFVLF